MKLLVEEVTKVSAVPDPDPDPRIGNLCKIVKLLALSQKNLTSAVIDAAKVGFSASATGTGPRSGSRTQPAPGGAKKR
jgi:hypothetical protein